MRKLLAIVLLTLTTLCVLPRDGVATVVLMMSRPPAYKPLFIAGVGPVAVASAIFTAANSINYLRSIENQRLEMGYLGTVFGGLTIASSGLILGFGIRDRKDYVWWGAGTMALGAASTAIGIHSIVRINKARRASKVSFRIMPTFLAGGAGLSFGVDW